jgi:hypothetical protein
MRLEDMFAQLSLFKGKRQRGVKAPPAKEFATHVMIADALRRWGTRGWRWTHLPFGEKRSPRTGARLKRMGTQKGWPDLVLLCPFPPQLHMLEIKRKGEKLRPEQEDLCEWCKANGYIYETADNFKDALAILSDWGAVRTRVEVT